MKILALYLPQFHRIKENDEWWGEGFTEWTNIKKAKPLFENHNQPRVPDEYYDLTDINVMRKQAKLATDNGIYGFCVYHYWFNGHLLLEKPMENFLKHIDINLNFCFCWANENWTNAWVSSENKILISQNFEDKNDWINHFNYLLPFFKDERYIKEDNKPLFVIYIPSFFKSIKEFIDCWNKLAIENGFDGIKFIYQHNIYYLDKKANHDIFDYEIQFQPNLAINEVYNKHNKRKEMIRTKISVFLQTKLHIYLRLKRKKVTLYDYDAIWKKIIETKPRSKKTIAGAFVDWDNTPRRGLKGSAMKNVTVEKFKKYFDLQVKNVKQNYNNDYLIMFSWNEWAEGGYLEYDKNSDGGYLKAVKEVLINNNEFPFE